MNLVKTIRKEWQYKVAGIFKDIFAGYEAKFVKKNLNSSERRVLIILAKDNNEYNLVCTKELSAIIRTALEKGVSKPQVFRSLMGLEIQEDNEDSGRYFLFCPKGRLEEEVAFSITSETVALQYEELLAGL